MLYSVVTAFLLEKGCCGRFWKSCNQKWRRVYEEKVKDIRNKISIAKSELERLQENRKVTKKGKRNRTMLREALKGDICVSAMNNYMEKTKSALRKVKRWSCRRKKQEEARSFKRGFKKDPGRICSQFNAIFESDKESKRPMYKAEFNHNNSDTSMHFENIEEANDFWKYL